LYKQLLSEFYEDDRKSGFIFVNHTYQFLSATLCDVFCLLFKDTGVAHSNEEEWTIAESGQGKIQKHKHTSLKGHHSLTH